jgi:hypothetical protein
VSTRGRSKRRPVRRGQALVQAGNSDRSVVEQRRWRWGDKFDVHLFREITLALFLGALWKLIVLLSFGEPYSTVGADTVAIATLLVWEVAARLRRMDRAVPPIWLIGVFCVFLAGGLSTGGAFHIANGVPSSVFYISGCGCFLIYLWRGWPN